MHERPIGDLVDALRPLGCDIECFGKGRLPAPAHQRGGKRTCLPPSASAAMSPASSDRLLLALPPGFAKIGHDH